MKKFEKGRINPKNYDGIRPTSKPISELLPRVLKGLTKTQQKRPDLVLALWPEVVGAVIAKQTRAVSFCDGILLVHVSSSTLLSLLVQNERIRLLKHLRDRVPDLEIKNIVFKMGNFSNL